jgi:hypothetical protein
MNEYIYSTHLYLTPPETDATAADMLIMIEGLGRNILKHLGNIELGKSSVYFYMTRRIKLLEASLRISLVDGHIFRCYGLRKI